MNIGKEADFETDLNLDFDKYARHFVTNEERYTEEGFFFYQIQTGLEESPRAHEVVEDLETMAEEGLLEKETIGSSSKLPNDQYFLKQEQDTNSIRAYTAETRDWTENYIASLKKSIPRFLE